MTPEQRNSIIDFVLMTGEADRRRLDLTVINNDETVKEAPNGN